MPAAIPYLLHALRARGENTFSEDPRRLWVSGKEAFAQKGPVTLKEKPLAPQTPPPPRFSPSLLPVPVW